MEGGFTLIEVMVALVIFVIAIIGCYRLQIFSSLLNSTANSVASASAWAAYITEDLFTRQYSESYTDPVLVNGKGDSNGAVNINDTGSTSDGVRYVAANGTLKTTAAASDLYTIYWNIVDDSPVRSVKQIRVIVVKKGGLKSGRLYTQDVYKLGPI